MDRILFWVLVIIAGWNLYTTGIAQAVLSGNIPQVGRECRLCGPKYGHVCLAFVRENVGLPIDATIGGQSDRHPSQLALAKAILNRNIICPQDNTKAKVLENSVLSLYSCPHRIAKVKILSGPFKGKKGWVQREDVIDTPVQQLFQTAFRESHRLYEKELEDCNLDEVDFASAPVHVQRRPKFSDCD